MQATNVAHNGRPAVAKTLRKELRMCRTQQEQYEILSPEVQALAAMKGVALFPLLISDCKLMPWLHHEGFDYA